MAKINRGMCPRQFLIRVIKEDLSEKVTFLQTPDSLVGAAGQLKEQKEDPLWPWQSERG